MMRAMAATAIGVVVSLAGLALPTSAVGAGGTYNVVQCHPLHRGMADGRISDNAAYAVRVGCADPDAEHALKIDSVGRASPDQAGRVRWVAPPGTGIVAVHLNARLRRDGGHKSRIYMADDQLRETHRVATGTNDGTGWINPSWSGPPQDQLVVSLHCEGPSNCPESSAAKTWVRGIRLTLKDFEDPELEVDGSLLTGGWLRGQQGLGMTGRDSASGVRSLDATVNGTGIAARGGQCSGSILDSSLYSRLQPCTGVLDTDSGIETGEAPFKNGVNDLEVCVSDVATNRVCRPSVIRVDNAPPQLLFAQSQDPEDPELLSVSVIEPHSGLDEAQVSYREVGGDSWTVLPTVRSAERITARVDSAAEPPGEYEFRVEATDVAGNQSSTMLREDGTPMRLTFPLRSGVDLMARLKPGGAEVQSLDYGESSRVAGRLTTAAGEPMAGYEVVVDEYFGEGALIDHRIRTVTTDENGRWSSKLPAGPSRSVTARFAGDQRYLDEQASGGRLAVRTGARFGTSRDRVREGRKIMFKGRVGRLGARIPNRGKLIQLQYHDPTSRRWFTVRNAFYTDSRGRYRFGYKFGRHYLENVKIRFRLRVMPESEWPYRPTNTRSRRVVVVAR